jgi:hypothetical protein
VAVVHLDDLDVEGRIQHARDLLDQPEEQVHADAHVGRPDDRRPIGVAAELTRLLRSETGGADHVRAAPLGAQRGVGEGGLGRRELDDHLRGRDQRRRVVAGDRADRVEAGQQAEILADRGLPGPLDAAGELGSGRGQHLAQIGAPHSARAADDPDPHPTCLAPAAAPDRAKW